MKPISIYLPTKVLFGSGVFDKLRDEAPKIGKRALVVTTGLKKTNIVQRTIDLLESANLDAVIYNQIESNPKTENIDEGVRVFQDQGCDFVIGLGGGSAMDAAKAIAVVSKNGGQIRDYVPMINAKRKNITESFPVICISTTAGTGSEVTMFSVVTIPETLEKPGLGYECMYPKLAIVDPTLTASMPASVTAEVGIDTFFHAMENYLSKSAHVITDMYSLQAMEWVIKYLPIAYSDPENIEARSYMHLANLIAGYSITVGTPATLHAISHAISGITDIAHGQALSMAAVAFLKFTHQSDYERYAKVARLFSPTLDEVTNQKAAEALPNLLQEFLSLLGLPSCLKTLNFTDDDVRKIARDIFIATPRIANQSLRSMTENDVYDLLRLAL